MPWILKIHSKMQFYISLLVELWKAKLIPLSVEGLCASLYNWSLTLQMFFRQKPKQKSVKVLPAWSLQRPDSSFLVSSLNQDKVPKWHDILVYLCPLFPSKHIRNQLTVKFSRYHSYSLWNKSKWSAYVGRFSVVMQMIKVLKELRKVH